MVNLGDYLGQLLSELSIARLQADLEAIRIAELYYSNHKLLKNFPVPRVRFKDIELNIPMVVLDVDKVDISKGFRGHIKDTDTQSVFITNMKSVLSEYKIEWTNKDIARLDITREIKKHNRPNAVRGDSNFVIDKIIRKLQSVLKEKDLKPEIIEELSNKIRTACRLELANLHSLPPRVNVGVTSREIKESSQESIVRLSVTISEEGLEWNNVNPDNEESEENTILIPE